MSDTSLVLRGETNVAEYRITDDDGAADIQAGGSQHAFPSLLVNQKIPELQQALPDNVGELILGGKSPMPIQHGDGCAKVAILGGRFIMVRRHSAKHADPDLAGRVACVGMRQRDNDASAPRMLAVTNGGVIPPHYVVSSGDMAITLPDVDMPTTNDCSKCGYGLGRCGGVEAGRGFADPSKIKMVMRGKPYVPSRDEAKRLQTKPAQDDCQATWRIYLLVLLPNGDWTKARCDFKGSNFATGAAMMQAWQQDNARPGSNGTLFLRNLRTKRGSNAKFDYLTIEYAGPVRDTEGHPYRLDQYEWESLAKPTVQMLRAEPLRYYASLGDTDHTETSATAASTAPTGYDDAY